VSDSILTLGLAEQFELVVEIPGRVTLPPEVRAALGLEPGDRFSIERNPVSLRLDSFRELEADWLASSLPDHWREEISQRPQTALERDGALPIPSDLLSLPEGGRLVLEVVTKGLSHELYLYRVAD
jgi:hypothetical protein